MRIALAAEGTRGDVYPMLALGESLRAEGHEIVLCAPPDFRLAAEERGIEHRAVGVGIRDYLTAHADALAGGNWAALREGRRFLEASVEAQFRELPEAAGDADGILGAGVQAEDAKKKVASVHDFKVKDIDGKEIDLSKFRGQVLMLVNVASQ